MRVFKAPRGALAALVLVLVLVLVLTPCARLQAGEDGPIGGGNDATCGGNKSVCGTYASALGCARLAPFLWRAAFGEIDIYALA